VSAEILRRASALMRERAEAARSHYAAHHPKAGQEVPWFGEADLYDFDDSDGPHIIGMSPAVALAVADWLSRTADLWECGDVGGIQWNHALAVARAYLGRDA